MDREEASMSSDYTAHNPANWQIEDGMTVYGSDGEKLGTVRNYDRRAGYLDVQKGWLFAKDFYVPLSAIQSAMGDGLTVRQVGGPSALTEGRTTVETATGTGITLRLTKEDLEDDRYASPPAISGAVDKENFRTTEWTMTHETEPIAEREVVTEVRTHDGDFYE
jgi:hypothetical protein